jgi:hypothetical protein
VHPCRALWAGMGVGVSVVELVGNGLRRAMVPGSWASCAIVADEEYAVC